MMQSPPGRVRSVLAREFTARPLRKNRKVASRGTWAEEPARAPQSSRPTPVDCVPRQVPNPWPFVDNDWLREGAKKMNRWPLRTWHMVLMSAAADQRTQSCKAKDRARQDLRPKMSSCCRLPPELPKGDPPPQRSSGCRSGLLEHCSHRS